MQTKVRNLKKEDKEIVVSNFLEEVNFKTAENIEFLDDSENKVKVGNEVIGYVDIPSDHGKFIDSSNLGDDRDFNLEQWYEQSGAWILSLSVYDSSEVIAFYERTAASMILPETYKVVDDNDFKIYMLIELDLSTGRWIVIYSSFLNKTYYFSFETYSEEASLPTEANCF